MEGSSWRNDNGFNANASEYVPGNNWGHAETAGGNGNYGNWGNQGSYGGYQGGFGGYQQGAGSLGSNLRQVNWGQEELVTIQKNFYQEQPEVSNMSPEEIQAFRQEHNISFQGRGWEPNPIREFQQAGFPDFIMANIRKAGFERPSPIQAQGWPIALGGADMIGIADTGSGKTLAFLLPAMIHIKAQPRLQWGDGPIALVLAPTRELAIQIQEQAQRFGQGTGVRNTCVYGGVPKGPQIRDLRHGREIVIATPGRLIDLCDIQTTNLKRVTYLVLDEADRMLDMGFEDQIRKIASQIRPDRQTLLWSATWPREVQALARDLCKEDPVHLNIGSLQLKANHRIVQHVSVFEGRDTEHARMEEMFRLLRELPMGKKLIFSQTKKGADVLCREIRRAGLVAQAIHGDKRQEERDWALAEFKNGRSPLLIATDVAARGIDVKDVQCVINFDFPSHIEDYVHRIGRTGRGGADGLAYSFFTTDDKGKMARELVSILEEAKQEVPHELYDCARRNGGGRGKGFGGKGYGKGFGGKGSKGFGKGFGKGGKGFGRQGFGNNRKF